MEDYGAWADEYLHNAELTQQKIDEYKAKRKAARGSSFLLDYYNRKIEMLTDMYYDCMHCANKLRRKANSRH